MAINAHFSDDGSKVQFKLGNKTLGTMDIARSDALSTYIIDVGQGRKVVVAKDDFDNEIAPLEPGQIGQVSKVHELSLATILKIYQKTHQSDTFLLVDAAASAGDLEEVKKLLSSCKEIHDDELANAMNLAISGGHFNVVEFLLSKVVISEEVLLNVMKEAAYDGHLAGIQFLLSKAQRSIPEDELGNVISSAAYGGHRDVVKFLLSQGSVSKDELLKLMNVAACCGHRDVVEYLLPQLGLGTNENELVNKLGDAIRLAAYGGHREVQSLLSKPLESIPEDKLEGAMNLAASGGHLEVLQFLLSRASISIDGLICAMEGAAYGGHLVVVEFLLSKARTLIPEIPEDELRHEIGNIMSSAAYGGHLAVVKFLSELSIPHDKLEQTMNSAASGGHPMIVEFLLRRVPDFDVHQAVITASRSGHSEIVALFLEDRVIREETKIEAIRAASGEHREEIVSMLQNAPIAEPRFIHPHAIHVSFTELKENPLKYLNLFSSLDKFPPYFVDKDSPASDMGGVRRQFVTVLMEELVKQNMIPLSATGLPMIREGSEENDKAMMEKLGHFYSLLEESNRPKSIPSTTGGVFHPAFFEIVKAVAEISREEDLVRKVAEILKEVNPNFALAAEVILKPNDADKKATYATTMGVSQEEAPNAAKEFVLQYVSAAECFYRFASEDFANKIKDTDSNTLCTYVQGEGATADVILHALHVDSESQNPDSLFVRQVGWLKEFIKSKDDASRRQFLKAVTGSTSLPAGAKIKIKPIESTQKLFAIATCSMSIQMPVMNMSREQYLKYLDEVFSSPDDFTDI